MTIAYLPVHFSLRFTQPALVDTPPLFVLRSMLGRHLRSMSCISRQNKCNECVYNCTCAYAFLFETILPVQNDVLPKRNRASHPFAFTQGAWLKQNVALDEYDFTITLLGKAVDYLPYIYAAFVRAGKDGIFKSRTQFEITEVCIDDQNILRDSEHLDTSVGTKTWRYDKTLADKTGKVLVELHTPLRFKYNGVYGIDFTTEQFMACLYRRMKTLCLLYGTADALLEYDTSNHVQIADKMLTWAEKPHYSARQKDAMTLGGIVGTVTLQGSFSAQEQNLLVFNKIFNAGKNTNFGLGQMDFWTKWE